MFFKTPLIALALYFYICQYAHSQQSENEDHPEADDAYQSFQWSQINPTEQLVFHECLDNLYCARLKVPLDWNASQNSSSNKTAAIAIVKLPAQVPVTDPRYGGVILLNPGGPGQSGVVEVLLLGEYLQQIVDSSIPMAAALKDSSPTPLYFDIIGFDPRGVNNTTPTVSCFPDDWSRRDFAVQSQGQGILTSNDSFPTVWGRVQAVSAGCSKRLALEDPGIDGVGHFVSTPVVARDMIEIAERLGEWREQEAQSLTCNMSQSQADAVLEGTRWRKGEEKIMYWGISYGTVLGATFAALYPDRVQRMVLDGVVDAEQYYRAGTFGNLHDADKVMAQFYAQCYAAGPNNCAVYSEDGPVGTKAIYEKVLSSLSFHPLPVPSQGQFGADLVTYSDLKYILVRAALYSPESYFPVLAQVLFELSNGNGTSLAAYKQGIRSVFNRSPQCEMEGPWSDACYNHEDAFNVVEYTAAIYCTDAPDLTNRTADDWWSEWQKLRSQSVELGDIWGEIVMYCGNWTTRPASEFNHTIAGDTAHPILWLSNSRDPVTPLDDAVRMAQRFPGSALVYQEADGHTTLLAAPSTCIETAIRQYFQTGALPSNGTVCTPDSTPFPAASNGTNVRARSANKVIRKRSMALEAGGKLLLG